MKTGKRELKRTGKTAVGAAGESAAGLSPMWISGAALAALTVVFWAYSPAMRGAFLFDDNVLPFALPMFSESIAVWVRGVRPLLMATYWVNFRLSGDDTFSFHVVNVLIHCVAAGLVFLIVRRLLDWARRAEGQRTLLAGFAAAVFLLHPIQAEAVAYLAGRSEAFSGMLVLMALTVFLYRRKQEAGWGVSAAVLALFAAAILSKEHTVALLPLLLLTDLWWSPGFSVKGIRGNWRIYLPAAAAAAAGIVFLWPVIMNSSTAGFGLKGVTWYEYFFTQCRALFVYPALFLAPVRLTADWDFPLSRTILDHGAIFGLLALAAISAAAWRFRNRFRLASYGWFAYLVLMAPTSSVLPIMDPIAERRLYFSMLGLLLIVVDFASRLKVSRGALAGGFALIALILAGAARGRAGVWENGITLWEDTAAKSPNKERVHFQLGYAYFEHGQYGPAIAEFARAAQLKPPAYDLLVDWALAYDLANRPDEALAKLRQAAAMEQTAHVYSQIGMIYAKRQQWGQALDELAKAERLDPNYAMTYVYKGGIFLSRNEAMAAIQAYNRALTLEPANQQAREGLLMAQQRVRGR